MLCKTLTLIDLFILFFTVCDPLTLFILLRHIVQPGTRHTRICVFYYFCGCSVIFVASMYLSFPAFVSFSIQILTSTMFCCHKQEAWCVRVVVWFLYLPQWLLMYSLVLVSWWTHYLVIFSVDQPQMVKGHFYSCWKQCRFEENMSLCFCCCNSRLVYMNINVFYLYNIDVIPKITAAQKQRWSNWDRWQTRFQ